MKQQNPAARWRWATRRRAGRPRAGLVAAALAAAALAAAALAAAAAHKDEARIRSALVLSLREVPIGGQNAVLKLPLTIIFYIYACHRKDLHLLSHFVRLTLSYCGILCSIR
eukprot:COSAG06_NODE_14027_length_1196_cov_5.595260_2_plen_112_part_00